jgi:hypothetical protein
MFDIASEEEAQNRMTFEGSPPPRLADAPSVTSGPKVAAVAMRAGLWPQGVRPWATPRSGARAKKRPQL